MKNIFLFLFGCLTISLQAQYVGIGTETPTAMLDINGDVVFRTADLTVEDSVTLALDVNTEKFSSYRISGADSAFTLAGITAGMDGRLITLINESQFPMELNNEDSTASPADQIMTGNHENMVLEVMGMVTLQYDTSAQKWLVNSSNQIPAGADVWDTTGTNIFFDNFVGIGTDEPTAPLSIETEVDETGFSHMAGPDSITLASSISELAAFIGTTSDHRFSLKSGNQSAMHVLPNGQVLIGSEASASNLMGNGQSRDNYYDSKLTVMTGLTETGFMHVGTSPTEQVIVEEAVGGVSASIGTRTNHTFRLMSNQIGRLHVLEDGRVTISPNYYAPWGQLTVYQPVAGDPNNNGLAIVTPNNTNGVMQIGGDGQKLCMRIGGSSAAIGTFTPHIMRIVANSLNVINIDPAGNIGVGINDPLPGYKMAINGNVKAKELVIETTGWPDYVFSKNHQLPLLSDVEKFIHQHHHLPNIPTAADLETNGVAVGDMQKKMMEKIEELTLYLIEQQNEINDLKSLVTKLSHE